MLLSTIDLSAPSATALRNLINASRALVVHQHEPTLTLSWDSPLGLTHKVNSKTLKSSFGAGDFVHFILNT